MWNEDRNKHTRVAFEEVKYATSELNFLNWKHFGQGLDGLYRLMCNSGTTVNATPKDLNSTSTQRPI